MSSKIKQYFANKENRIKCGITGGTIALAVIIFVGMVSHYVAHAFSIHNCAPI